MALMFFLKFLNLISFLHHLCSVWSVLWFLLVMCPVREPTSKGSTDTLWVLMSVEKCSYFSFFKQLAISILCSPGQVSSNIPRSFFFLSSRTISYPLAVSNHLVSGGHGHHCSMCTSLCPHTWQCSSGHCHGEGWTCPGSGWPCTRSRYVKVFVSDCKNTYPLSFSPTVYDSLL